MSKQFLSVLLVILLLGCGGGGSSGVNPAVGDLPEPSFTDAQIIPELKAIISRSDSFILGDFVGKFQGDTFFAPTSCSSKTRCTTDFGGGYTGTTYFSDVQSSGLVESLNYTAVGERNGVRIARGQGDSITFGLSVNATSFGAWLDHSAFTFALETVKSGSIGNINFSGLQTGYGASVGNDAGSRPAGSATWTGVMVGGTDINGPPQSLRGDATITYDSSRNDLDILFHDIYNIDTNQKFQNLQWSTVFADSTGLFYQGTVDHKIQGRFYGPNHAEIGGVFTHPVAIGAFGAKRN